MIVATTLFDHPHIKGIIEFEEKGTKVVIKGNLKSKISIGEKYITQKLTIFNDDNEIMPFSMGWHPWFKRTLSSGEIEIKFDSQYKWEISDELPTSKKIKSSEIDKFKNGYSPAPETLDDCYRIKDGSNVLLKWPELTF